MKQDLKIAAQAEQSHAERASTFPGLDKASDFPVTWFCMLHRSNRRGQVLLVKVVNRRVQHFHMFCHCFICIIDGGTVFLRLASQLQVDLFFFLIYDTPNHIIVITN